MQREIDNNILMQVERIQISKHKDKKVWNYCDNLCFKAKNLFNRANFLIRQHYKNTGKRLRYKELDPAMQSEECYKALPSKTAQQILKKIDEAYTSYYETKEEFKLHPEKFLGKPKAPRYKEPNGRALAIHSNQQCHITNNGTVTLPFIEEENRGKRKNRLSFTTTKRREMSEVRFVPFGCVYVIEVVYKIEVPEVNKSSLRIVGADIGLNNIITLSNNIGETPIVVKGGVAKSINHNYNKQLAEIQAKLAEHRKNYDKANTEYLTSIKLQEITLHRNNAIHDFMHKTSKAVIDYLVKHNIDLLIIGNNQGWKQEINLGKVNNQNFVQIPFSKLIHQLEYKCRKAGIDFVVTEESWTSKASFIDGDEMKKNIQFSGKRISRGLYETANGTIINADVNGACNIIRKVKSDAFGTVNANGLWGGNIVFHPVKLNVIY